MKRALLGMLVAAAMAVSPLGLGAASAGAGISHVGGDQAPASATGRKWRRTHAQGPEGRSG